MSTNSTIWMGDIEPKMTEHEIMNFFHKYNIKPQSIKLMKDKATNENKNYCFISFKTIKEANTALFRLNGKKIPGYSAVFRLNWASIRSPVNKSVYVGNLNPKVDDIKLYNLFKKKYPTVQNASVVTNNGVSKGYGFVLFNGEEDYEKCIQEMNGIHFYGNNIKVKEQRKKQNNFIKNNDTNSNSDNEDNNDPSSINDSENYNEGKFINNTYKNNININGINNYSIKSSPLNNTNDNISLNNNILINAKKIINTYDLLSNSEINNNDKTIGINNIKKNVPYVNIININENININNNIGSKLLKKSNFSNNSIISLNSINSEQISNYSTAEQFNKDKKQKNDESESIQSIDEFSLNRKIHEGIQKMYHSYKNNPFYDCKMIKCK